MISHLLAKFFYSTKFNKHAKNCSTTRAKTFKSHYWLKVVKQKITECKFHKKLLTVVEQHIIACFQNAFFWL